MSESSHVAALPGVLPAGSASREAEGAPSHWEMLLAVQSALQLDNSKLDSALGDQQAQCSAKTAALSELRASAAATASRVEAVARSLRDAMGATSDGALRHDHMAWGAPRGNHSRAELHSRTRSASQSLATDAAGVEITADELHGAR